MSFYTSNRIREYGRVEEPIDHGKENPDVSCGRAATRISFLRWNRHHKAHQTQRTSSYNVLTYIHSIYTWSFLLFLGMAAAKPSHIPASAHDGKVGGSSDV